MPNLYDTVRVVLSDGTEYMVPCSSVELMAEHLCAATCDTGVSAQAFSINGLLLQGSPAWNGDGS